MCGRYTLTQPLPFVEEHFRLSGLPASILDAYRPRYNVAPGQPVLAVIDGGDGAKAEWLRWGLVPSWAKDPSIGYRLINARSETAAQKPSFRRALRLRRCLLPADGFYEWRTVGTRKVPFRFRLRSGGLFALAGLWEEWSPPDGNAPLRTCTVLTTEANDLVATVHHRMPVIVPPAAYDFWLDRRSDVDALKELFAPYPADEMDVHAVSPAVNSARNDHPGLLAPEGGTSPE